MPHVNVASTTGVCRSALVIKGCMGAAELTVAGLVWLSMAENKPCTLLGFGFGKTEYVHLCDTLRGFQVTHSKSCGCVQTDKGSIS